MNKQDDILKEVKRELKEVSFVSWNDDKGGLGRLVLELEDAEKILETQIKKAVEAERERVIGQFWDFGRERYQEPFDKHSASPSERWKRSGELRLVAELNRFCKQLSQQEGEDE